MTTFHDRGSNFLPTRDTSVRQLLYVIATGNSVALSSWFQYLLPEVDVTLTEGLGSGWGLRNLQSE